MDPVDLENIRKFIVNRPEGVTAFGNAGHFDALPETHREQILFLDKTARKYLFSFTGESANLYTGHESDPFAKGNFRFVEKLDNLVLTPEGEQELKKWLFKRSLPFRTWVFVLFEGFDDAILMTWKMVVKYSGLIFFSEDVMVFDKTLNWCLFYFHENEIFFGRENRYDPTENERAMQALNERKKKFPQFKHPFL